MAMKSYFLSLILKEYSSCLAYFCLLLHQAYFFFRGKPYVPCLFNFYVNIRKTVKMLLSIFLYSWIKVYFSSLNNKELKTKFSSMDSSQNNFMLYSLLCRLSTVDLAEIRFLGKPVHQDILLHGLSMVLFS